MISLFVCFLCKSCNHTGICQKHPEAATVETEQKNNHNSNDNNSNSSSSEMNVTMLQAQLEEFHQDVIAPTFPLTSCE